MPRKKKVEKVISRNYYIASVVAVAVAVALGVLFIVAKKTAHRNNLAASASEIAPNLPFVGTEWVWLHTELSSGSILSTEQREEYVLVFGGADVKSTTDCNTFMGTYTIREGTLSFTPMGATEMYCKDSLEQIYATHLLKMESYKIVGKRLHLRLKDGEGKMVFERK